jgi:hypothetical protein
LNDVPLDPAVLESLQARFRAAAATVKETRRTKVRAAILASDTLVTSAFKAQRCPPASAPAARAGEVHRPSPE